ncbi:Uncharacterized membrane protein [Jannaschia faecimaris]|uniref:Uncharacterized membrane protein n=1 Tax=Jannaschia faecimaris TaxID=1244108 RepID=A0A1H3NM55_9RHOB|nr:DUF2244 domain-containing protein [Jannaschia faecimaris]SDY89982.1 Uncharacterized membrane protein [Jannaschia faecimaris]
MPYKVTIDRQEAPVSPGAFLYQVELWPHQSLTGNGFVWIIGGTFVMAMLPLFALLGTVVLWGILPFAMISVGALWWSLNRSWRDRDILETFTVTNDTARLTRQQPDGTLLTWEANSYWVRVKRHDKVNRIVDYLTLEGGPRKVEIGAFLTPEERRSLQALIDRKLAQIA